MKEKVRIIPPANGDFTDWSEQKRQDYAMQTAKDFGLTYTYNLFQFIPMKQGRDFTVVKMYVGKEGAAEIARQKGIKTEIVFRENLDNVYIVGVRATVVEDGVERCHEDIGSAYIPPLKVSEKTGEVYGGENSANAIMKASTKARRRAILMLAGLPIPDEEDTEYMSLANMPEGASLSRDTILALAEQCRDAADINKLFPQVKKMDKVTKERFHRIAVSLGLAFNSNADLYEQIAFT